MNKSNEMLKSSNKQLAMKSIMNYIENKGLNKETQFDKRKKLLLEQYPFLRPTFESMTKAEIKKLYYQIEKWLLLIDLFCFFADLIVVCWLYFNHFEYNKHNYCTNANDNTQRFICLSITILVMISLLIRYQIKKQYNNCKYFLCLRVSIPIQIIKYRYLIAELVIHLIQPLPHICVNFTVQSIGAEIKYSLDSLMFVLSLIRLYVLVKQFRNWNIYTNGRGEKIAKFFNNNEMLMFLYRTNLKNNGALTLALIFITLALVGGYVLKVFENHQPTESQSNFGDFWTCLWFIAQTMTTIGYGDHVPTTLVGRLIAIVICFFGIFTEALFTISILMYITLIDEREEKAFAEIKLIYSKEKETNIFNVYFTSLIKNKMVNLLPNKNTLFDDMKMKESNKLLKERYALRVLVNTKIPITLTDFCLTVKHSLEPEFEELIKWGKERNDLIKTYLDFFCNTINQYRIYGFNCFYGNTQMLNMALMIYWCGPIYRIDDYKMLKKDNIVSKKSFVLRLKEFFIKFEERKNIIINTNTNNDNSSRFSSPDKKEKRSFGNSIDCFTIASKDQSQLSDWSSSLDDSIAKVDDQDIEKVLREIY